MNSRTQQNGFTLIELLVAISLFAIFSLGVVSFMTYNFRQIGLEARSAVAAQELRNAVNLLSNELRMGNSVSPYLPGIDASVVTCSANLQVTADSIRFLVVHDDNTAVNGMTAYYVGYRYDSTTETLFRGEVASTSTTSCVVPGTDPLAADVEQILARRVVRIDSNDDLTLEPIFSFANPTLTVNLGMEVRGNNDRTMTQELSTQIRTRKS